MPQAIFQLVHSHYGDSAVQIEVIYNSDQLEILDETLKLLSEVRQIKVTKVATKLEINKFKYNNKTIKDHFYNNEAIFLFDTWDKFQKLFQDIYLKIYYGNRKMSMLVHCEDLKKRDFQDTIHDRTFGTFLIEENNEITLNTMTMFTEQNCSMAQRLEINRFSPSKIIWETQKFFNPKFVSFYGCVIKSLFDENDLPFLKHDRDNDPLMVNAEGAVYQMVVELSKILNFTHCHLINCIGNSHFSHWWMVRKSSEELREGYVLSHPILSTSDVFVVPPGESYTSWEKLFLPFDDATWMWLGITFAVAFLVIIFVKLTRSTSMYEFIIGSNVTTPALNVIGIFMGIGQILLPQRNISRFLFMVFVLFCLIMRTAYQGKYFEFITTNVRKSPVKEIAELKERNFTLFTERHTVYNVTEIDALKGSVKFWFKNY